MEKRFLADRAVIRALKFCTEGMVPLSFTWLHSSAGPDGRLMEHKYSTLEHISTGSLQPKQETRRPSIDAAFHEDWTNHRNWNNRSSQRQDAILPNSPESQQH